MSDYSGLLVAEVGKLMYGDGVPLTPERLERAVATAEMIREAVSKPMEPSTQVAEVLKSIGPDLSAYGQAIDQMRAALADLGKEITFQSAIPSTLGLQLFDLEGPARALYPVLSPLRNLIPRTKGVGSAALAKVISGISGSGSGGVGIVNPAISLTSVPTMSAGEAARGVAVNYATSDVIVGYKGHALYDAVTLPAFIAGQGFQDLRALVATKLMQSAFNIEEALILTGRDAVINSGNGPACSGSARDPVAGETGITGTGTGGTNVYIKVTAIGYGGLETAGGATATVNIAATATKVIDVTITDVTGALGYKVYAKCVDSGGAEGSGVLYLYGQTGFNKFTVGADGRVTTGPSIPANGGTDAGTGSANNYRGLIQTVEEGPALGTSVTGYVRRINAKPSGGAVTFLQEAFASMWDSVKANPDEIWVNGRERKSISDLLLNAANTLGYRVALTQEGGVSAGLVVNTIVNETTGKPVKLSVHPWLPIGNAVICSYNLPFPTAFGATTTLEVRNVQDYMQISWPMTTLRFENTIYWQGALVNYAPAFFGVIHGIAKEDNASNGRLC